MIFTELGTVFQEPVRFLVIGSLSAMVYSLAKTGFAGGLAALGMPIMLIATRGDARISAGIILPLLIAADYVAIAVWWRKWNIRSLFLVLPGTFIGVAAGGIIIFLISRMDFIRKDTLPNDILTLIVGTVAITFVILYVIRTIKNKPVKVEPNFGVGSGFGASTGIISTFTNSGGPIFAMYLIPQQLDKRVFVATTAIYFWILNQVKLAPYLFLDMINVQTIGISIYLVPGIALGALIGKIAHSKINQKTFNMIIYSFLFLAGIQLVIKSLGSILAG